MPRDAPAFSPWLPGGWARGVAAAAVVATLIVGWVGVRTPGGPRTDHTPAAPYTSPKFAAPVRPPAVVRHDHDQDGQDVLYGDGEAPPFPNPYMGTDAKNIYTWRMATGVGPFVPATSGVAPARRSIGDTDPILLPAAK